jgi:hypothetical protein
MSASRKHFWADFAFKFILVALAFVWMRVLPMPDKPQTQTTIVHQSAQP